MGHAVEPVPDLFSRPDTRRLAHQNQKGGLKRVFGILGMADHASADSPDHRGMTPDQGSKSRLVALANEAVEQLPIRHGIDIAEESDLPQLAHHSLSGTVCHHLLPQWTSSTIYFPNLAFRAVHFHRA